MTKDTVPVGPVPNPRVPSAIAERTCASPATETLRLTAKPSQVKCNDAELPQGNDLEAQGWTWHPLKQGGILKIKHDAANEVTIIK